MKINYNEDASRNAYNEFLQYLDSIGLSENTKGIVKMAFVHGFAKGAEGHTQIKENIDSGIGFKLLSTTKPTLINSKRVYPNGLLKRTHAQMVKDNIILMNILLEAKKPLEMSEVIARMRENGREWSGKNATSYINLTIRRGLPVVKLARGLYAHKQYAKIERTGEKANG